MFGFVANPPSDGKIQLGGFLCQNLFIHYTIAKGNEFDHSLSLDIPFLVESDKHGLQVFSLCVVPEIFMNKLVKFCLGVCVVMFVAQAHAEKPEKEPRLPLAMEVFLKKPQKRVYEIHIHLTNISREALSVNVHDLPWTPPNDAKWFMAFRMDESQRLLAQRVFRGKFGSQPIRLVPGESIQGTLVLNYRIPTLVEDILKTGVTVKWDCPPKSLKFMCKPGTHNSLTIPKADPGLPDVYSVDKIACRHLERRIGLVNIPKDHHVLFLLAQESVMTHLDKAQSLLYQVNDYVHQCQPTWTNSWSVSFFTEKRFAGFVSDLKNEQYFEKGLWQQANIGQYSSQTRTLFRFPWIRKKTDEVYLSVYR